MIKVSIGQDSHRLILEQEKSCAGGIPIEVHRFWATVTRMLSCIR